MNELIYAQQADRETKPKTSRRVMTNGQSLSQMGHMNSTRAMYVSILSLSSTRQNSSFAKIQLQEHGF